MEKYFTLLLNKKNRIKALEQNLNEINKEILKYNEEEEIYNSKYKDEMIILNELTKEQEERVAKCKILNIFLILVLAIIIGTIFFSSLGLSILKIISISIPIMALTLGLEYLIIRNIKNYYGLLRILDSEEIKMQKLKIIHAHKKIIKVSKHKEQLIYRKNKIEIEINKEKNNFNNITNQVIEKFAPLLDNLIEKGLETDTTKKYEDTMILMKKLIENN